MATKGKNSPEKLLLKMVELEPVEFLGICKILGVDVYKEDLEIEKVENVETDEECGRATGQVNVEIEPKEFADIWNDVCDAVYALNRTRRRTLGQLIYAATKKEKE